MLEIVSGPVPMFESLIAGAVLLEPTAVLLKEREFAPRLAIGAAAAPVPLNTTDCGDPKALSATLILAVRVPATVGLKVTTMVHDAEAATLVPHVLVCE